MVNATPSSWAVRGATFAVWLLAAGSCVFWGLKLASRPSALTAPPPARAAAAPDVAALVRLLGSGPAAPAGVGAAPAPALSTRFVLVGVVDAVTSQAGAAVIAVDGKPARPFRVGAAVDDTLVLQSVEGRRAVLGPAGGAPAVTLELPPRK
jgi:general secretion pathway protein C